MPDLQNLKRVDLSDLHQPAQIANRIHRALSQVEGPVPAVRIARALDISQVRLDKFDGFEGMLLTDRRRSDGVILANTCRGDRRARFTAAHELGHFLMERHVPSDEAGFRCTAGDMQETREMQRHFRQEKEANRFAIELLAPGAAFKACANLAPDLEHVRKLSTRLDLSKEATARRYRELHEAQVAMVFHRNGLVRYVDRSDGFPPPSVKKDTTLPASVLTGVSSGSLSELEIADPKDWFDGPPMAELSMQTLYQKKGYGITMLILEEDDPDDAGPEDTYNRYSRLG